MRKAKTGNEKASRVLCKKFMCVCVSVYVWHGRTHTQAQSRTPSTGVARQSQVIECPSPSPSPSPLPSPAAAGNSRPIQPDINASNFNILNNTEIKVLAIGGGGQAGELDLEYIWEIEKHFADAPAVFSASDLIGLQKQAQLGSTQKCSSGNIHECLLQLSCFVSIKD